MKKTMVFVLALILLFGISFIGAQEAQMNRADGQHNEVGQNSSENEIGAHFGEDHKLKDKNTEADTDGLNVTSNGTQLKVHLSNGRNAEIKIMPDTASETALARLRLKVCNETRNCTIQLKEVGQGNETRLAYELQIERHSRILGIFEAKMQVRAEVDAETGEVISVGKPWWAFLATQPEEETPEVPENETVECVVDSDCPISNCPSEANSTCIEGRCAIPACISE